MFVSLGLCVYVCVCAWHSAWVEIRKLPGISSLSTTWIPGIWLRSPALWAFSPVTSFHFSILEVTVHLSLCWLHRSLDPGPHVTLGHISGSADMTVGTQYMVSAEVRVSSLPLLQGFSMHATPLWPFGICIEMCEIVEVFSVAFFTEMWSMVTETLQRNPLVQSDLGLCSAVWFNTEPLLSFVDLCHGV